MTADVETACQELAQLWPALPDALQRDTTGNDTGVRMWPGARTLVNQDVQAAIVTLAADIPATVRTACEAVHEPWRYRGVPECLRQYPRLAQRMVQLGITTDKTTTARASRWLRTAKLALGLRYPDENLRGNWPCPHADAYPENHPARIWLIITGREGFLRDSGDGLRVVWIEAGQIFCPSELCGRSWSKLEWEHLANMLKAGVA